MKAEAEESVRIACLQNIVAIQDVVELLSGKWRVAIIVALTMRPRLCFTELKTELPFISAKVLTSELKLLEYNKLIVREEQPGKPLKVLYALSNYGHSLEEAIFSLLGWGLQHRQMMLKKNDLRTPINDYLADLRDNLPASADR